ncbi:MAG: phosphopantothenoylcysteine decarboxylase / phosphopantothenate---cysteine ligase [Clostridiales bacterium]|jgi:phosphopantothenoylcysteine decarboxylase/phosphopantothenate--cysteine ligase|nr:phosphopantothenoylcysteine decarboxylase / phosphopantothenate---cysteine ligase [Clostridiales bacterium]MDN5283606.1 phosphopantothenoylcysteine decarboxylase / phosphopantothenate---cysteine ligase [Candidatus Ozemobacter sp.]
MPPETKKNVLFQLTGSIACYKACGIISKLVQNGCDVQTLATDAAMEFVGNATLEGLTRRPVITSMFERNKNMAHISLVDWADIFVLCPASANSINALACGLADTLIGATFLSNNFRKPYLIAPAMNNNMYDHPATQEALKKLENWGAIILPTGEGRLACGTTGKGRLLDPEIIFKKIMERLK